MVLDFWDDFLIRSMISFGRTSLMRWLGTEKSKKKVLMSSLLRLWLLIYIQKLPIRGFRLGLTCPEAAKWFLTALKMLDVFLGFSNSALLSASEVSSSNWSKRLSVSVASKTVILRGKISKYYFLWYIFVTLDRYIVIFQTCENISQIPNPSQFYHHYYLKNKMLISFSYHAINHIVGQKI